MEHFIYGFIFAIIGLPLLQMFSDIIIAFGEVLKGLFAVKVTQINKKIAEISGEEKDQDSTPVIGFIAPEEEDENYENEN